MRYARFAVIDALATLAAWSEAKFTPFGMRQARPAGEWKSWRIGLGVFDLKWFPCIKLFCVQRKALWRDFARGIQFLQCGLKSFDDVMGPSSGLGPYVDNAHSHDLVWAESHKVLQRFGPQAKPNAEATAKPKAEPKPALKNKPKAKQTVAPKAEPKGYRLTNGKAQPKVKPKIKQKANLQAKPKAKLKATLKTKPAKKTTPKPSAKPTAKLIIANIQ